MLVSFFYNSKKYLSTYLMENLTNPIQTFLLSASNFLKKLFIMNLIDKNFCLDYQVLFSKTLTKLLANYFMYLLHLSLFQIHRLGGEFNQIFVYQLYSLLLIIIKKVEYKY